jgi:hypothetical protein
MSTETYTVQEAWENACKEEGIPVDSKFVVFSETNQWAEKYERAVKLYLTAHAEAHRLAG